MIIELSAVGWNAVLLAVPAAATVRSTPDDPVIEFAPYDPE